jgi:hypothetical protein
MWTLLLIALIVSQPLLRPLAARASDSLVTPFEELLRRPVNVRPELQGQHPRIFFDNASLKALRTRAHTTDRELWQIVLRNVRALKMNPPEPGSPMLDRSGVEQEEGDMSQYDIAYILAEATFAYSIEQDPRYLEAAKHWLLTVIKYDPWGYTFRTPNVDLPPAHLLYAVGFAYDALYNELTVDERAAVRTKLAHQAHLMYEYFKYKPKKKYSYSQNHTFIPMTGLAVAAFALMGEEPEAEQWAQLAHAVYDRVLETFDTDGYYYEGFHYSSFSLHWIIRYLDALEHTTGEDLYPRMQGRFLPLKYYIAHSILPDGKHIFDFGDAGRGAADRNKESKERLNSGYEVLYRLAAKYKDAEAQGIADWLRRDLGTTTFENIWAFDAHDANLRPTQMSSVPTSYYFRDSGTAFWRSGWNREATVFAFRCGPPEGHHTAELLPRIPDWRLNTGHAHPDANSFIIYSHGKYLTGDTGYTGIKLTGDHNTVLVDERGEENEGRHEMFKDVPYERLDQIRIEEVWSTPEHFYARGEAAPAYFTDLGLKQFTRHFLYVAPDYFIVWDELSTAEPRQFSWLLNAERTVNERAAGDYLLPNGEAALLVERIAPAQVSAKVEPQMVTTQGRPGEVEKGEQEQRGFQLIERTEGKMKSAEFLHFMRAASSVLIGESAHSGVPQIEALKGDARGVRINWGHGDTEWVLLRGAKVSDEELLTDGARAVLRLNAQRTWTRLIVDNGSRVSQRGTNLLTVSRPATVSFAARVGEWWGGSVVASAPLRVTVNWPRRPHWMLVNGAKVEFTYDESAHTVTFGVGAGTSTVEAG